MYYYVTPIGRIQIQPSLGRVCINFQSLIPSLRLEVRSYTEGSLEQLEVSLTSELMTFVNLFWAIHL